MLSIGPWCFPQCSLCGIETIKKNTVQTEISHKDLIAARSDPVGVGAFLALFVGAEGAGVFNDGGVFAEFAVGEDWEDDHVAGGVVGDEEVFAGFVEREIARILAGGGEFV